MIEYSSTFEWRRPKRVQAFIWDESYVGPIEEWHVGMAPTDAIEWKAQPGEPVLVETGEFEAYCPLQEETGLFLMFAETELTQDACLQFASKHGPLTGGVDPFTLWRRSILIFRHCRRVVDVVEASDERTLKKWLRIDKDGVHLVVPDHPSNPTMTIASASRSDVGRRIEAILAGRSPMKNLALYLVSRALVWEGSVLPATLALGEKTGLVLEARPVNLLAAMGLQMLDAIVKKKDFQKCPACERWFELTPGVNRANKVACSLSCRKKLYYARTVKAREMAQEGKTVKRIAKELGSDIETVKGWIAKGGDPK